MKMNYKGKQRKELAAAIAEITGEKAVYMKAPTYAYQIGKFTIQRHGELLCADHEKLNTLLRDLAESGFNANEASQEDAENESTGLTITVPATAASVGNLENLLTAKGQLIKKALSIEDVSIKVENNTISFPWFSVQPEPDEVRTYTELIAALCKMSKNLQRVSSTERPVENEKYAFRCFLLRLGFIGNEYKTTRQILLRNLSGNSAWKNGAPEKEADSND
jgi:hypothetical protein